MLYILSEQELADLNEKQAHISALQTVCTLAAQHVPVRTDASDKRSWAASLDRKEQVLPIATSAR